MIHAQPKRPVLLLLQETAEKVGGVLIARHARSDAVGIGDIRAQRYLETVVVETVGPLVGHVG